MTRLKLYAVALCVFDDPEKETAPKTENVQDKHADAAPAQDKSTQFRKLIDGEYKNEFTREFQRIFDRRFKEKKEREEDKAANDRLLKALAARYKTDSADASSVLKALENAWAKEEESVSADARQKSQDESLQLKSRLAAAQTEKWQTEAQGIKEVYPEFDLTKEISDPMFLRLVQANVPLKQAYETVHLEDILKKVALAEKEKEQKRVTDNIRIRGMRPPENGIASQSGMTVRQDVSRLTREQREDYARRAAKGEEITFRR